MPIILACSVYGNMSIQAKEKQAGTIREVNKEINIWLDGSEDERKKRQR